MIAESSFTRLKERSNVHRRVLKFAFDGVTNWYVYFELVPCELF